MLFAGDALHHPIQISIPERSVVWDEDHAMSVKSRLCLLDMCADEHLVLAPAHFTHQACHVSRKGNAFAMTNMAMADIALA